MRGNSYHIHAVFLHIGVIILRDFRVKQYSLFLCVNKVNNKINGLGQRILSAMFIKGTIWAPINV